MPKVIASFLASLLLYPAGSFAQESKRLPTGIFETRKRRRQSNQKYFQCRTPASRAARA